MTDSHDNEHTLHNYALECFFDSSGVNELTLPPSLGRLVKRCTIYASEDYCFIENDDKTFSLKV
jgi:hypothetical protein